MLIEREFVYVLLGQFQSDVIVQRFGWYRQLSGVNYFVSVRQIIEAEKFIRVRTLIKFSNRDIIETKAAMAEAGEEKEIVLKAEIVVDGHELTVECTDPEVTLERCLRVW